jgi:hypothetical protein
MNLQAMSRATISITMDKELLDKSKKKAREGHRSFSGWMGFLAAEALAARSKNKVGKVRPRQRNTRTQRPRSQPGPVPAAE